MTSSSAPPVRRARRWFVKVSSPAAMEAIAKENKFLFYWVDLGCCSAASNHTLVSEQIRGLLSYSSFINIIWMNLLPYAGALLDVSAVKGEDATSSCSGFKDLSHWLKFMKGDFASPPLGRRLYDRSVGSREVRDMEDERGRVHGQVGGEGEGGDGGGGPTVIVVDVVDAARMVYRLHFITIWMPAHCSCPCSCTSTWSSTFTAVGYICANLAITCPCTTSFWAPTQIL